MSALVCDICGGKLVMGTGGIAICDSCGLEHSVDRIREKIQEIKGVVQVDNSHMVENWMKMGTAAAQAGNNKEAYDYFTKVIEVDPNNWRAIYEKGKAGAWQSTLANLRTAEIYQGITMALEIINRLNISDDELISIKNEFAVALFNINNAITDLMGQNLSNLDDKYFNSHWDQMWDTKHRYITNVSQLEDAMSLISDYDDNLSKSNVIEFKKRMCSDLRSACASTQYWHDYSQTSLGYLGFNRAEKKPFLDKYWKLVDEIRDDEPEYATAKWSYPDPFDPGLRMSDECFRFWQKTDAERQARKEAERRGKRYNEYWENHTDYKTSLEAEKMALTDQIASLQNKIELIPEKAEIENIRDNILLMQNKKNNLGLFKGKEKKSIQEEINNAEEYLKKVSFRMDIAKKKIEKETEPLMKRIMEIDAELTKDR